MWYGKDDEPTREERMESRIAKLEREQRRRDNDDNFSMTANYAGGNDDD